MGHLAGERLLFGHEVEKIRAHRQHYPQRRRGVVCHTLEASDEARAGLAVRIQGVQFLELVHEEQHALAPTTTASAQYRAEMAGLLGERVDERLARRHVALGWLIRLLRYPDQDIGECGHRLPARTDDVRLPWHPRALQGRYHAGPHE